MINVEPITQCYLFKTLCMGTSVAGFNDILFKARRKTFDFIQEYFKEKICLADENSKELKAQKETNEK